MRLRPHNATFTTNPEQPINAARLRQHSILWDISMDRALIGFYSSSLITPHFSDFNSKSEKALMELMINFVSEAKEGGKKKSNLH